MLETHNTIFYGGAVVNFETFSFHLTIMAGIRVLGYVTPTPIQLQSIPPIMQGRDLIGLAQIGTGKSHGKISKGEGYGR